MFVRALRVTPDVRGSPRRTYYNNWELQTPRDDDWGVLLRRRRCGSASILATFRREITTINNNNTSYRSKSHFRSFDFGDIRVQRMTNLQFISSALWIRSQTAHVPWDSILPTNLSPDWWKGSSNPGCLGCETANEKHVLLHNTVLYPHVVLLRPIPDDDMSTPIQLR